MPYKMKFPLTASRERLRQLVSSFSGQRILVLGDLMLDQYIRGHSSRISPEAPVPVVSVDQESCIPGGAGNVAHNLASLGASVRVLGVLGEDEAGRRLSSELKALGVLTDGLLFEGSRLTSQKCRVVAERQQVVRYDRETQAPLGHETEGRLIALLPQALREAQAVILSDYGKGVISPRVLNAVIPLARKLGLPVTVDPKVEHFRRYRGVSCITPNLQEAWAGMGRPPKPGLKALEALGRDILRALKSASVLITRGAEGMSLFKAAGRVVHIPTQAREVFDVTGAGDTVIAALTLALAGGARIEEAASLSNYAAGIVVGKLGTAVASPGELERELLLSRSDGARPR